MSRLRLIESDESIREVLGLILDYMLEKMCSATRAAHAIRPYVEEMHGVKISNIAGWFCYWVMKFPDLKEDYYAVAQARAIIQLDVIQARTEKLAALMYKTEKVKIVDSHGQQRIIDKHVVPKRALEIYRAVDQSDRQLVMAMLPALFKGAVKDGGPADGMAGFFLNFEDYLKVKKEAQEMEEKKTS